MCCKRLAGNTGRENDAKNHHLSTVAQLSRAISSQGMCRQSEKKLVKQQYVLHMSHNMVNFGPLAAEISLPVWGTPANFNGFHVLAALLHCSQVVSVSQTLRHWTEGATYVRQVDHDVGHWPTFLVVSVLLCDFSINGIPRIRSIVCHKTDARVKWLNTVPPMIIIITTRYNYASAVLKVVILSVCPSVCLSVRLSRVLCD